MTTFLGVRDIPIRIESLKLLKVSGYQKQYLRPLTTQMNGDVVNSVSSLVADYNGKIPANALAKTTSRFIMPHSRVDTVDGRPLEVTIPNGWDEGRFVFSMHVVGTVNGLETTELVTGYTDFADYTGRGDNVHIPRDTVFYINSIAQIGARNVNGIAIPGLRKVNSVLGGGLGAEAYSSLAARKMTPPTLIHHSQANSIDGLTTAPKTTRVFRDDISTVSRQPSLTARNNMSPTSMTSRVIETYAQRARLNLTSGIYSRSDIFDQTRGAVADSGLMEFAFLKKLSTVAGVPVSTFDFGELLSIDPYVDEIMEIHTTQFHTTQMTAPWDAPTREAIMATVASTMVTAMMGNYSLGVIEFVSTNEAGSGNMLGFGDAKNTTQVTNLIGFDGGEIDHRELIYSFEDTISDELGEILSENGEIMYSIYVRADLNTDIEIHISFDGQEEEIFTFPSFSDALISPLLTTDSDLFVKNTRDIHSVLGIVDEVVERNMLQSGYNPARTPTPNDVRGEFLQRKDY